MHRHANDYWGLTISGTWADIEADGTGGATGPGDYSLVKGTDVHADCCGRPL